VSSQLLLKGARGGGPMSQFQRLLPLVVAARAILTRLYRVRDEFSSPGARPGFFKDADFSEQRRAIQKAQMKRDAMQKAQGWDKFTDRAPAVLAELQSGYEAIKDVTRFRQVASEVIASAPGAMPLQSTLTSAQNMFLELITLYAKVVVLVSSIGSADVRLLVGAYNAAHFVVHKRDDDHFVEVAAFVTRFVDQPLREAAIDLDANDAVKDLVSALLERHVARWLHEPLSVTAQWTGEWTGSSATLSMERARSWLVWTLLVLPGSLGSKSRSIELALKQALSTSLVCQVFRNVTLRLHDEFGDLYAWYQPKRELDAKPKKIVSDAAVEACNSAAEVHRGRRVLLSQRLRAFADAVDSQPGVVGAALPSMLSTLSLSKEEALWYFMHTPDVCGPPRTLQQGVIAGLVSTFQEARYKPDDWVDDASVGELAFAHEALRRRLERHWSMARDYHRLLLVQPDALATEFKHPEDLESAVGQLDGAAGVYATLLALHRMETNDAAAVGKAILCCDVLEGDESDPVALCKTASLADLVFFPRFHKEALDAALASRTAAAWLWVLSWSQHALHPYANEEFEVMCHKAGTMADDVLARMQVALGAALDALLAEQRKLDGQANPLRAAERLFALRERKRASKMGGGESAPADAAAVVAASSGSRETGLYRVDERAGFESRGFQPELEPLRRAKAAVRGLALAMRGVGEDDVVVWDRLLVTREFFRETVRAWLARALGAVRHEGGVAMQESVRAVFGACAFACEQARMDATPLLRAAFLGSVVSESGLAGAVGDALVAQLQQPPAAASSSSAGLGDAVVFSPPAGGMVRVGLRKHDEDRWVLHARNAAALAAFMGVKGLRVVCGRVLAHVGGEAAKVRALLQEADGVLQTFRALGGVKCARAVRVSSEVAWRTKVVGVGLCMVDMLNTHAAAAATVAVGSEGAGDLAMPAPDADVARALASDAAAWAMLPWCLAASAAAAPTADNAWLGADFIVDADAHANNAHCIAVAVATLSRLRANGGTLDAEFLRAWSDMMLCIKPDQALAGFSELPVRAMFVMAEKIVLASSSLDQASLAETLPRALIEAAVMDRALGRSRALDAGVSLEVFLQGGRRRRRAAGLGAQAGGSQGEEEIR